MSSIGRMLILFGLVLVIAGGILMLGGRFSCLGRLPGDIYIQKKGFTFFFPITTSILISLVLSVILILLRRR